MVELIEEGVSIEISVNVRIISQVDNVNIDLDLERVKLTKKFAMEMVGVDLQENVNVIWVILEQIVLI